MSSWQIEIPFRHRDDSLTGIIDAAREVLEGEERAITRQVVVDALGRGVTQVGDLLDELEAAGPAGRRELLDQARENCGLPSTARVDAIKEAEAAGRTTWSGPMRDSRGRVQAMCSQAGCTAFLPGELSGSFKWVEARRWWCEEHRAGHEDDLQPYTGPRLAYSASGAIIDLDQQEAESERARAAAESRRERYEAKVAQRREDAERLAAFEQAAREQFRRESITGGAS